VPGGECLKICVGSAPEARPLDADVWLMQGDVRDLAAAHRLAGRATVRLKRSHRSSQTGKGAMLLASSFELLPPSVAAALGNAVTLGLMRYARSNAVGEEL
jgi:cation transport ATPase